MNAIGDLDSSSSEDEALATVLDRRASSHSNQQLGSDGHASKRQKVVSPTPPTTGSFVPPLQLNGVGGPLPPVKSIPISKGVPTPAAAAITATLQQKSTININSGTGFHTGHSSSGGNHNIAAKSDHPPPIDFSKVAPHNPFYKENCKFNGPVYGILWTREMDARLVEALAIHGNSNWGPIAAHVGEGCRNDQARKRWVEVLNPDNARLTKGPWTKEQELVLLEYVKTHMGCRGDPTKISWEEAPDIVGRLGTSCAKKYKEMLKSTDGQNLL